MKVTPSAAVLVVGLGALGGCDGGPPSSSASPAADASAPSPPVHAWQVKKGQEYGYAIPMPPDETMTGRAARVIMLRYLGASGGVYTIARRDSDLYLVMSCSNPCQVIKRTISGPDGFAEVDRIPFNDATIIGRAFTDAFNGQLEVYGTGAANRARIREGG
jgi:hypothetical protein